MTAATPSTGTHTQGGLAIAGNVDTHGGDVANRDIIHNYHGALPPPPVIPAPPALSRMVLGRDRLRDELAAYLQTHKSVALYGLPGVGKSTLALAVAHTAGLATAFPAGRAWLPIGPSATDDEVLNRTLAAFGLAVEPLADQAARCDLLRRSLAGRATLLLLDDVWQVAQVAPVLAACHPPVTALLTMRSPQLADDLQLRGWMTPVLDEDAACDLLAASGPAARQAVLADRPAALALAQEVGQLPLALHVISRLLTSVARSDGPARALAVVRTAVADHLLALRAADPRLGLADPQPALGAALMLSYDQLPTDEVRAAYCRLAVFGGRPRTFGRAALDAVWGVPDQAPPATADTWRWALADAGLLEHDDQDPARYALHPVIARHAAAQLNADAATARSARLAHARHYASVAAGWDAALSQGQMTYQTPLEWAQVAAALDWLAGAPPPDAECDRQLLAYTHHWRNVLFNNHDPRRTAWLAAAQAAAERNGDRLGEANVLKAQGDVLYFLKQTDEALRRYEAALALYRAVGARLGEANVLQAQGDVALQTGAVDEGMALLEAARQLYAHIGARAGLSNVGIRLARWAAAQGEYTQACALMQPAADFGLAIGHPLGPQLQAEIDGWRTQLTA